MDRLRTSSGWTDRRPPKGRAGVLFWLAVWFGVLSLLRLLPGTAGTLCAVLQVMVGLALVAFGVPALWRLVRQRLLWSLRNKLVLTYLLVGLAPLVLIVTLVLVSGYIAAGQFAMHLAEVRLDSELDRLSGWNALAWDTLEQQTDGHSDTGLSTLRWEERLSPRDAAGRPRLDAFLNGDHVEIAGKPERPGTQLGLPPWATQLSTGSLRAMVRDEGELYLVAVQQQRLPDGRRFSLMSSVPVDRNLMREVAKGLGRAGMLNVGAAQRQKSASRSLQQSSAQQRQTAKTAVGSTSGLSPDPNEKVLAIFGGTEPTPASVFDLRVRFLSTLPALAWDTGKGVDQPVEVDSRPSRLYQQLFGASLSGFVTQILRISLLVLCVLFAMIEALALWMAMRLSRTVTASVTGLYEATQRIDRGDLQHSIPVERDDQMAELSRSFNRMMGSLQRLLLEQKDKQRMENELSIAQEVQANLFPHTSFDQLPTLELHGICRPARAVSGDYYDFLLFGKGTTTPGPSAAESATGVGIAVGDISGKGISAALLMATLHSAVRAYQLAGEELLLTAERPVAGSLVPQSTVELFESPGRILSLLNRHLYRSTQPEKYATLFLAHYDASSARLTYSNAGQLPPLVLRTDDTVKRLDCGGTVVGLIDGMEYEQESVTLRSGDVMVAYSDGVTEPENDFGDFGEERLMEVVRRYRDQPLHVISAQVMLALDAWIGAEEQPDDITLVLARQI